MRLRCICGSRVVSDALFVLQHGIKRRTRWCRARDRRTAAAPIILMAVTAVGFPPPCCSGWWSSSGGCRLHNWHRGLIPGVPWGTISSASAGGCCAVPSPAIRTIPTTGYSAGRRGLLACNNRFRRGRIIFGAESLVFWVITVNAAVHSSVR